MPLEVSIVSPEEELYTGEAEFIRAKTVEGEIGILTGHIPLLAQLAPCEVKVRLPGGAEEAFRIDGGFMTVKEDKVIILAEELGEDIAFE
ncbi:MAG: ATP synthase F1 subunit epsilon [Actinobacteria bacterium]|nr:ATP synthase F1 subunit epsilon [Actinomycetota bacterium]